MQETPLYLSLLEHLTFWHERCHYFEPSFRGFCLITRSRRRRVEDFFLVEFDNFLKFVFITVFSCLEFEINKL